MKPINDLQRITVGNGIEYAVDGDQLLIVENNRFNEERIDPFKYFRFVALVGFIGVFGASLIKIYNIVVNHQYYIIDFMVVLFFIFLALIPLRFVRKTKPTVLKKK